jgi:hypothetical protein
LEGAKREVGTESSDPLWRKKKETEPASIRSWVAILLTIVALWFVDFLLKPVAHRHGIKRSEIERRSVRKPASES